MTQTHRLDLCPEDGGGGRDTTSLSDVHTCFPSRGKILFTGRLLQVGHLLKCTTLGWGGNSRGQRGSLPQTRRGLTLLYQDAGTLRSESEMDGG